MPPRSSSGRGRYGKIPPRSRHYQQQSASQKASSAAASASSSNSNTQQQSTSSSSGSSSFSRRSALNKNNSRYNNNNHNNHGSNSKQSASATSQGLGSGKASATGVGNTSNTSLISSTTNNTSSLKNSKNDQLDLSKYNFNKLTNPSETLNAILKEIDLSYDSSLGLLQGDSIINLPSNNKLVIIGKLIKKMIKELDGIITKDNSYLIRIDEKISKITGKPREFQKEKLIISLNRNRKDDSSLLSSSSSSSLSSSSDLKRKYSDIDSKLKQSSNEKLKDKINDDNYDSNLVNEDTGEYDDEEDKLIPKKRRRKITLTNKKDSSSSNNNNNNNNNSIKESAVDDKSDSDELSDLSVKKESEDEDDVNDLSSIKSIEIDDLDNGSSIDSRIASVKKENKESIPTDNILSGVDDDADEGIKLKNRHTIKIKGIRSDIDTKKDDDDDAVIVIKKEKFTDTDKKIEINEDDEDEDEEKLKINNKSKKITPNDIENKDNGADGDDEEDEDDNKNNNNNIDYELDLKTPRFVPSIYKDKPKIEFPINEMIEPVVKSLDLYPSDPQPCPPDESPESEEFLKKKYAVTLYPHDSLKSLLPGEIPLTDFSGSKPNNQIAFTTFQTYIEPIFKLFSDDDIRFLKNKYNLCSNLPKDYDPKITPFLIPKLGAIYTDVWHQEDINSGMVKVENPKEIENFQPEKIMIENGESMIRPKGSEDNITNDILETEDISCGPLTSRLLSAIMSEDLCDDENGGSGENGNSSLVSLAGTPFDDDETNETKIKTEDDENNGAGGSGGTTLWKSSVLRSDYSTLDERLKTELKRC
ncbi:unnamed protein product [[Candida] boidinii]|uniref:Unnamed protein product n=1 Tax=Candida boidinii TaxID=5477 RepID=A0ACB5TSF6_CANBO|nr:unnamed protein product [[Candida] boidinii]